MGKFVPDVEPVTVVLVNSLTTNFDFDVLNKSVANLVDPSEVVTTSDGNRWKFDLKVDSVD